MDYQHEARKILYEHTAAVMSCCITQFDSNQDMLEDITKECAFILTEHLLDGDYTPMQYNAIRNELAQLLWNVFAKHINKEEEEKRIEFVKLFSI